MKTTRRPWSRNELLIAFKLYCETPFGKMHSNNPRIVRYAELIGRTPSAMAMKLTNIASLDPVITSTGRKGLTGASAADKSMWLEMQSDWDRFAEELEETERMLEPISNEIASSVQATEILETDYTGRERFIQARTRVGQGFFRLSVLSSYDSKCCISGLTIPRLLVASHIIPWRVDPRNRLNPRNGLCLSPIHDRAFDLGILTIDEQMAVRVSKRYADLNDRFFESAIACFDGKPITLPEKFTPDPEFLAYHRDHIFEYDERS